MLQKKETSNRYSVSINYSLDHDEIFEIQNTGAIVHTNDGIQFFLKDFASDVHDLIIQISEWYKEWISDARFVKEKLVFLTV